jgi:hypothetical protein
MRTPSAGPGRLAVVYLPRRVIVASRSLDSRDFAASHLAISSAIPQISRVPTVHNSLVITTPSALVSLASIASMLRPIGDNKARTASRQEPPGEGTTSRTQPCILHLAIPLLTERSLGSSISDAVLRRRATQGKGNVACVKVRELTTKGLAIGGFVPRWINRLLGQQGLTPRGLEISAFAETRIQALPELGKSTQHAVAQDTGARTQRKVATVFSVPMLGVIVVRKCFPEVVIRVQKVSNGAVKCLSRAPSVVSHK